MNKSKNKPNFYLLILTLLAATFISSCSNNEEDNNDKSTAIQESAPPKKVSIQQPHKQRDENHYKEMSQPLDKATWTEKGKFRKEFADDCIARETANANGKVINKKYLQKTCACIANYMDDHLTDQEAEEYLRDDNHNRSLQIRFDSAAYSCLQATKQAKN